MNDALRESAVLESLDVSVKRLRALRHEHLATPEHWDRDAAGIFYTPEAVELLRAKLAPKDVASLPLDAAGTADGHAASVTPSDVVKADLTVLRVMGRNDRAVLCAKPDLSEVMCRVKSTEFLKAGMVLRDCRQGEYGAWSYYGALPKQHRGGRCLGFFPPRKS